MIIGTVVFELLQNPDFVETDGKPEEFLWRNTCKVLVLAGIISQTETVGILYFKIFLSRK